MLIKAGFSRRIPHVEYRSSSRLRKGECAVWQRRYWENLIRDQQGLIRHIDYIHYNPVKHGHALCAADWPYSSIHRYIRGGVISANCGGAKESHSAGFGERD